MAAQLPGLLGVLLLSFTSACAVDALDEDGESDRYLVDGKADTGGIAEGSPEAAAVLRLASTFDETKLSQGVGLAASATRNIVAYRLGDDQRAGTADDERFDSLAELDAVPFVGPIAFGKMVGYARAHGLVSQSTPPTISDDPFDPAACQGPALPAGVAMERIHGGDTQLGSYQMVVRTRHCADGSCEPWQPLPLTTLPWAHDATGRVLMGEVREQPWLMLQSRTCLDADFQLHISVGATCSGVGHVITCDHYRMPDSCRYEDLPPGDFAVQGLPVAFSGKITENCLQLISHQTAGGAEVEAAILARFWR